jgi:hypothetical protein
MATSGNITQLITFIRWREALDFVTRCPNPCKVWDLGEFFLIEY